MTSPSASRDTRLLLAVAENQRGNEGCAKPDAQPFRRDSRAGRVRRSSSQKRPCAPTSGEPQAKGLRSPQSTPPALQSQVHLYPRAREKSPNPRAGQATPAHVLSRFHASLPWHELPHPIRATLAAVSYPCLQPEARARVHSAEIRASSDAHSRRSLTSFAEPE